MAKKTLTASADAFHAYRTIYYPLFGKGGILEVPENVEVTDLNVARALTVQDNMMSATPYKFSDTSVAALAQAYQVLDDDPRFENLFDPYGIVKGFMPDMDGVRPMYPDFPKQVLEISEEQFRIDQARHYFSTYGVELLTDLMGCPIEVSRGWLPEGDGTEKVREDVTLIDKQIVNLVLSPAEMRRIVAKDIARPVRMHEAELSLAAELLAEDIGDEKVAVGFHENMLAIIDLVKDAPSAKLERVLGALCQHPGDVFKVVLHFLDKRVEVSTNHPRYSWQTVTSEKRVNCHLTTKQKKALCRVLETFEEHAIARNLADGTDKFMFAANALSIARFGGAKLKAAHEAVASGRVKSWNAEVEELWTALSKASDVEVPAAKVALLSKYGTRPGVLLRSMTRLLKGGFSVEELSAEVRSHADSYSMATLVRLCTQSSALDVKHEEDWTGRAVDVAEERARREEQARVMGSLAEVVKETLAEKLSGIDTPLRDKKVYLDTCGFSLTGSVVMPNDTGNTEEAYPPAGMAYDVPDDKVVRFFIFWDDRSKRVDVDSHFFGRGTDGRSVHVGWNSSFREDGIVFSGDITHSEDAVEYIDIDMPRAKAQGVASVTERYNIYNSSAAPNWSDIATCFCGALVVGSTEPDTAIYTGKNVLFHDDMKGKGSNMDYAYINVSGHYVRILRGVQMGFEETAFTLGSYLDMLFASQNARLVSSPEGADIVLGVGRIDDDDAICLIDEGFFIV